MFRRRRAAKEFVLTTMTVTAPDISCGNCVAHIEKDVCALAGVSGVKGDVDTKQVTITFDESKISRAQIAETMDEAGYPIAEAAAGDARTST
jgi:copper ion binding protein